MDCYRIVVTDDAVADLNELGSYIASVLFAPNTASNYVKKIRAEKADLQ